MTIDLDIGPLSWVKSEIDLALERAGAALIEHGQNPSSGVLGTAVKQLHQAHGALTIVGLDGITEYASALEQLFEGLSSSKVASTEAATGAAHEGISALRTYLDALMDGQPNQTLRLMPAYSALIVAAGAPAPGPAALFFPDLSQRPPRREVDPPALTADKLAARLKMARMGFERGLLKWLKQSGDEALRGVAEMKTALAMIEATQQAPSDRAFWWTAVAFCDALLAGALSDYQPADNVRKMTMRIGAQVKQISEGHREVSDRLMAELLFYIALAGDRVESVNVVRAAYRLDALFPATSASDMERLRPHIRRLREILNGAKEDWNKLCSGVAAALPPFHEKVTQAGELAPTLGNAALEAICDAVVNLTDAVRRDPTRHNDTMAIEVATALLLCDSALENFESLDEDFARHAQTMSGRLAAVTQGQDLDVLEIPHLDAMARRAQERLLLTTVVREIQANLATAEQALDAYFRDQAKVDGLKELGRPLKQIEGALMILGQSRAVQVLTEASGAVAELASGTSAGSQALFESIAGKLSGLGFFVAELERGGNVPDIDVILAPRKGPEAESVGQVLEPDTASEPVAETETQGAITPPNVTSISSDETSPDADSSSDLTPDATLSLSSTDTVSTEAVPESAVEVSAPVPASPAPTASMPIDVDEGVDPELLEIFLEEANEVLAAIGAQVPLIKANAADTEALVTLRRSFHTLKGSGRMVELNELGEAAWGLEQVLNLWMQEQRQASPELITLLDQSLDVFSAWIAQLGSGGGKHYDAATLNRHSAALFSGTDETPTASPDAHEAASDVAVAPLVDEASAGDERSLNQMLADMEAHERAVEARATELELAAAELEAAEVSARVAAQDALTAVSPAPITERVSFETVDLPVEEVPEIKAPALPAVSDEDLLAAELAAADVMAEGLRPQSASESDALTIAPTEISVPAESASAAGADMPAPTDEMSVDERVLAQVDDLSSAADQPSAPDVELIADNQTEPSTESQTEHQVYDVAEASAEDESEDDSGAEILPFPAPEPVRIGDLEVSATLFAIYIEEAQQHMATIQAEIGGTGVPSDNLIRAAHTLGSTSGTTGIEALHHLARALEVALGGLSIVNSPPTDAQRLILARCAGALEGMLGAVASRRLPAEELDLTAELRTLKPEPATMPMAEPASEVEALLAEPPPDTPVTPGEADLPPDELEFALPEPPPDATTETTPPPDEEEQPEYRHGARLGDEIDEQLLPIFLEEAADLMASIDAQLRGWRGQPDNDAFSKQLQRDLHTIKGSARMAGAMGCGDLFHSMESRIEQASAVRAVNDDLFDSLETSYDRGALLIERLHRGDYGPAEPAPVEKLAATPAATAPTDTDGIATGSAVAAALAPSAVASTATGATAATTGAAPAAGHARTQIQLRVRADLIDSLVNEAGEVAIARARIEGEMRALKTSLLELTDNVIRLRQQVREIEIQAETQMASQITELKAQAEIEGRTFDPLEFDRFTRFQELTRMMAESVNDVSTVQHSLLTNVTNSDAALSAQARINRELSQRLMGVRMMPFESLAERLHRVVRQAAKDVGKRANLDIKGGQMGIDRSVLEHIAGPLEHLLRNSVAHGVEDPATREANGKPGLGQITLSLAQEGNDVVLALSDDGAGLNLKRIRQRAIERGLMTEDDPTDDAHLIGMIFQSGFSTAETVSTIAGRGVGMDVVKTEIEGLGGRIEVSTTSGKGSIFRLYLPLTLAVSQAVIIHVGTRSYALPASMVEQASELKPDVIAKIREDGFTAWLGRKYPYRYLSQLLGIRGAQPIPARRHWLLLIKGGAERLAIEIDGMVGNREIVIKNLGQQLRRIPGMAGATVLSNGEIALILNPIALYGKQLQVEAAAQLRGDAAEDGTVADASTSVTASTLPSDQPAVALSRRRQPSEATIMVVDDSLTVRKVSGRLLGRHGYQVVTAKDGVDALEQLGDVRPDAMLVDIEMPRMDGFELTRNIRADDKLKGIPIIMITSRSADKHRQYAMEIGVNHYLGKPYDEDTLLGLIDTFVNPPLAENAE